LLDVGGGPGSYAIAFGQAHPEIEATILDKPEVLSIARRHVELAGLTGRFRFVAADLTRDRLGEGFDLLLLSNICHMLSPEQNLDLLRRSAEALNSGGRILIQDFLLDEDGTTPAFAALFAINMLVATTGGSSYRESQYAAWLRQAEFEDVRRVALPGPPDLMIGRKA
jgi:ubiquinone/menaquinone biosynthesis C-methylase UbiE